MTWNFIIGICSSIALFLPVFFILILKLARYHSFTALLIYYISALFYNFLAEGYISASAEQVRFWGITNNLLDIPLMLLFLTYLSTSKQFAKRLRLVVMAFIVFEIVVIALYGYTIKTITITLAPGVLLVCGFSLYFFFRYVKMAITHNKALGKGILASAVVFAYGCYSFIYLMYYVFKAHLDANGNIDKEYQADTFMIYFLVTIISSVLMTTGLIVERKRIRKLGELKVTRKELSDIYKDTEDVVTFRTAMLDLNKDVRN